MIVYFSYLLLENRTFKRNIYDKRGMMDNSEKRHSEFFVTARK